MKKLRIGIVGCGSIANRKHMPALQKLPEVEMVAFCDIVIERAQQAAADFGVEGSSVYEDYRQLVERTDIDVVHVCTPNRMHSPITVAALLSGKHVMCEKPMAISSEEAKKMLDAAKTSGKKLTIGYQNRYRPDSMYLHDVVQAGELGEVYYAKAHAIRRRAVPTWGVFLNEYEQGGGPLIDIGTHALDLTLWTMNNYNPRLVVGSVFHKLGEQTQTGNIFGDWDPEKLTVEDSAFGYIVMENGATISLEASWALNSLDVGEAKTTLCGTLGGADMKDGLRLNYAHNGRLSVEKPDLAVKGVDFYSGASNEPQDVEARMWISAILNDEEVVVKPEQAFVVTQILEAIYRSSKENKAIEL